MDLSSWCLGFEFVVFVAERKSLMVELQLQRARIEMLGSVQEETCLYSFAVALRSFLAARIAECFVLLAVREDVACLSWPQVDYLFVVQTREEEHC